MTFLYRLIARLSLWFIRSNPDTCPRVLAGYKCHKDSKAYNYTCDVCGRHGKLYDPEVIDRKRYDR